MLLCLRRAPALLQRRLLWLQQRTLRRLPKQLAQASDPAANSTAAAATVGAGWSAAAAAACTSGTHRGSAVDGVPAPHPPPSGSSAADPAPCAAAVAAAAGTSEQCSQRIAALRLHRSSLSCLFATDRCSTRHLLLLALLRGRQISTSRASAAAALLPPSLLLHRHRCRLPLGVRPQEVGVH